MKLDRTLAAATRLAGLLKGKVERAEGAAIGLDRRFTYFRYKREYTVVELVAASKEVVAEFDRV